MHLVLSVICTILLIAEEAMTDENLQCFNDYDKSMICQLSSDTSDCSRYNMSLKMTDWRGRVFFCTFLEKHSSNGVFECECSIHNLSFFAGETFTVNLWLSGNHRISKNISVTYSMKPKTPTIIQVKPTKSRNILVKWKTNYKENSVPGVHWFAQMSYRKKSENIEVSQNISSTIFELDGRQLMPNTFYALKIRTFSDLSSLFGDWSEEFEFTAPASSSGVFKMVIVLICLGVVILTSALFWYGVRLKAKWWDSIPKCSNPDLLYMVPGVPKVLDPPKIPISLFYVDCLDIDNTEGNAWTSPLKLDVNSESVSELNQSFSKDYPKTYSVSPEPVVSSLCLSDYDHINVTNEPGDTCLFSSYNNMTYFSSGPRRCPEPSRPSESSPLPTQPLRLDSAQHPTEDDVFKRLPPEVFFDLSGSTDGAPVLQTDFSYHSCNGVNA